MDKLSEFLKGRKSYIVAGLLALATFAHATGMIDAALFQTIAGLLGAGAVAALRAGIKKD